MLMMEIAIYNILIPLQIQLIIITNTTGRIHVDDSDRGGKENKRKQEQNKTPEKQGTHTLGTSAEKEEEKNTQRE